jgi:hypothetical protein
LFLVWGGRGLFCGGGGARGAREEGGKTRFCCSCLSGRVGPYLLHRWRGQAPPRAACRPPGCPRRTYDLFVWLGARLPHSFSGLGTVRRLRAQCAGLIERGLDRLAGATRGGQA